MNEGMRRMTLKNPGGSFEHTTYRMRADKANFRLEVQGGEMWMFGDLVNQLGRLEDEEELRRRNSK